MSSASLLPDEVWAKLDPAEARIGRVSRRILMRGGILLVVLATLVVLSQTSGLVGLRLKAYAGSYEEVARTFSLTFSLENGGWFAEHIDAIELAVPGAMLSGSDGAGITIPSRKSRHVTVRARITDCSQVLPDGEIRVVLHLHRFWGAKTQTIGVQLSQGILWRSCHENP